MARRFSCDACIFLGMVAAALAPARAEVTISSKPSQNMNCVSGVCTPTAKDAILNANDLTTMLASGNVEVNTGSGALAKKIEDIVVSDGFSWASSNSLTLDAYRSIVVDKAVSDAGSGAVALTTDDGGSLGTLSFGPKGSLSFLSPSNSLTVNGNVYTLANSVPSLAADIAANPSGFYALSASYDAKQDGAYSASPVATTFAGNFNGLGNSVSHLSIRTKARSVNLGLFADVGSTGRVSSIRVTSATILASVDSYVGIIAGINSGTVFNSTAAGSIKAGSGKIISIVGGLVGYNEGVIDETSASVMVNVGGNSSQYLTYAGGLNGANIGTISASYATGGAIASNGIGRADSGGLIGYSNGTVDNCYATGAANIGTSTGAGGLIGFSGYTVTSSYSTGVPTGSGGAVGGSMGFDVSGSDEEGGVVSNVYWDTTTSGITNLSQGAGNIANDPGITGETSVQLQAGLPAGFDPTIWAENPAINNGLPYLIANPPQ